MARDGDQGSGLSRNSGRIPVSFGLDDAVPVALESWRLGADRPVVAGDGSAQWPDSPATAAVGGPEGAIGADPLGDDSANPGARGVENSSNASPGPKADPMGNDWAQGGGAGSP